MTDGDFQRHQSVIRDRVVMGSIFGFVIRFYTIHTITGLALKTVSSTELMKPAETQVKKNMWEKALFRFSLKKTK